MAAGCRVVAWCRASVTGVLVGALVAVACNFGMLERKRRGMALERQER